MKTLQDLDFNNQRALIRVDFNVPLDEDQNITDDTRIQSALPTINYILDHGGSVILMSHLGRPKGSDAKFSLHPVANRLSELLDRSVLFADDAASDEAKELAANLQPGQILLLNNLRYYPEETAGDEAFAKQLADLGDMYINDAFGTAHRAHASTAVIAQFFDSSHKALGFLMGKEVENANRLLEHPERPFVAITGGAKVSDKIQILQNLIGKADHILIGGGMAYTFIKAQGGKIGNSLCEEDKLDMALDILKLAKENNTTIHLPKDSVVADDFSVTANTELRPSNDIPDGWIGLDIGPEAIKEYTEVILSSKSILWNGPMGVFEMEPFSNGTKSVAEAVVEATKQGAYSLIGGGDSAAAVNQFGFGDDVSHVSTGGGALLELFEGKELPGIQAISQ